jgi:hypothetical protein
VIDIDSGGLRNIEERHQMISYSQLPEDFALNRLDSFMTLGGYQEKCLGSMKSEFDLVKIEL